MTNNIWKMCVVAVVIASPVICSATTIAEAVATAGDGKYVRIDSGGSITLTFDPPVFFAEAGGDIVLNLHGLSKVITVLASDGVGGTYYNKYAEEYGYDGATQVYLPSGTWNSVTISAYIQYSDSIVYLDAVQVYDTGQLGFYYAHTGPVTPLTDSPAAMIEDLIGLVASFNLQQGIDNSLDAKLEAAREALNDVNANNDASAVNKLEAFIGEVEAQRNKKITDEQADELVADAQTVIALLTGL